MRRKVIRFTPDSSETDSKVDLPVPAKSVIPDWYKTSFSFFKGNKLSFQGNSSSPESTVKLCIPVLDAITGGYIQQTWTDIHVSKVNGQPFFRFSDSPPVVSVSRPVEALQNLPVPRGYFKLPFEWLRPWHIETPKGYSVLITHPFYRNDLPFLSFTGVIDSDSYSGKGKVGFFLREDFEGVIPAGTPIYQVIPFKREAWKIEKGDLSSIPKFEEEVSLLRRHFVGSYKKLFWQKKSYD